MAGGAEWSDSWWLLSHRTAPDVANGRFQLLLEVGSRQWGGTTWDLDIDLGRFDEALGHHDGDIAYSIRRSTAQAATDKTDKPSDTADRIIDLLDGRSWELTQSQIVTEIGGHKSDTEQALKTLAAHQIIARRPTPRPENGRTVTRELWGIVGQPGPNILPVGPGSPE